jgi:hypothetical protein
LQGIERNVDPAQACGGEVVRELRQLHAVGRHREVDAERRQQLDEPRHVRSNQRLATGDPNCLEAELLDAHSGDAGDLFVGQELVAGEPVHPLFGHAIGAAEVAAIRDRDPEILDAPIEGIDERDRRTRGHWPRIGTSKKERAPADFPQWRPEAGSLWLHAGAATNFSRRLIASPGVRVAPARRAIALATWVQPPLLGFARHGDLVTRVLYHSQ